MNRVALAQITVDPGIQPRTGGLDDAYVALLAEAPDSWEPVVVASHQGSAILVDGFHRVAAAQRLALSEIAVHEVVMPPDGDLRGLAFALNARHGMALTTKDRRNEADRLLRADPTLADREIARRCGLAPNTVGSIREQLAASGGIDSPSARIGHDGRRHPVGARRPPGEMPATTMGQDLANFADLVGGKTQRRQQRQVSNYLERLAVVFDDQKRLAGWTSAESVAAACRAQLSEDQLPELADRLEFGARRVVEVAVLLRKGGTK